MRKLWHPSLNFNRRPPGGFPPSVIVLHHSGGKKDVDLAVLTTRYPSGNRSSHYYVDQAGAVYHLVRDEDRAWHAGVSSFRGRDDVNDFSLGVELENLGDGRDPFPEVQIAATADLVSELMAAYGIAPDQVVRHRDVARPPGRKTDPAGNLDWEGFVRRLPVASGAETGKTRRLTGGAGGSAETAPDRHYRVQVGRRAVFSTDLREEAITFACGLVVRGERAASLYEPGKFSPWHTYTPQEIAGLVRANHGSLLTDPATDQS